MTKSAARILFLSAVASAAVFFGTANPVVHIPFFTLLLPAALFLIAEEGRASFRYGFAAALPGSAAALYWIAVAAEHYGGMPWLLAVPCSMALGACICLWNGAWTFAMGRLRFLPPARKALAAGILWYFSEWTRGWVLTGFPWLTVSSGLAAWPCLLQPLSLAGEFGYSGILAWLAVYAAEKRCFVPLERRWRDALFPLLAVALLAGWSLWRFAWMEQYVPEEGTPVTALLCQGNIRQDVKWTQAYRAETLRKYEELSLAAVDETRLGQKLDGQGGRHDFILWPETAMPFFYPGDGPLQSEIRRFARDIDTPVVFGALGRGEGSLLRNSACAVSAAGDLGRCDKKHLVPFGEYLPPVLDWKMFSGLLQGLGGFAAGEGDGVLRMPLRDGRTVTAGMLICYEAVFPEIAREQAAAGAEILLNISNDAWYDRTSAPVQHLHLSLMRAVEQGRFLCRSTNTGITAFVDPLGRVDALCNADGQPRLFESGVLGGRLLALRSHTPYFYLHPWLPLLAVLILAGLLLLPGWKRPYSAESKHFME